MHRAQRSDKKLVIDILSTSFENNESINYLIKQDRWRFQRLRSLMSYCFEICWKQGAIYLSDNKKGCILVLDSEKKASLLVKLRLNLKVIFKSIGLSNLAKVIKRQKALKIFHPKQLHHYLWLMGVFPEFQNRGIGTQLMSEIVAACDKNKRTIFLETSVARNISLYQRFGFRVFQKVDFGFTMYLMVR